MAVVTVLGFNEGATQEEANRAAVVVRLGQGLIDSRCVGFDEPQISGYELLIRAGYELEERFEGQGALVCAIDTVGCPSDDCFCQCQGGPDCVYWSYWHWQNDTWQYARSSATAFQVGHGMVEGWSWGPGTVTAAIEPPPLTFGEICGADTSPVTDTRSVEEEAPNAGNMLGFVVLAAVLVLAFVLLWSRRRAA
ncbi:MAG: hypothetical protein R3300_16700 [Candidatus Promineifilaceae bacterium]|nr:hypothetical protein [Candidatus Promineifilaceae bacterium]